MTGSSKKSSQLIVTLDEATVGYLLCRSMSVSPIIAALGGPAALARQLGIASSAVRMWSQRQRLPQKHALAVWRLAHEAGLDWRPPGFDGIELAPRPIASPSEPPAVAAPSAAA